LSLPNKATLLISLMPLLHRFQSINRGSESSGRKNKSGRRIIRPHNHQAAICSS
jgi:hypothetical protein